VASFIEIRPLSKDISRHAPDTDSASPLLVIVFVFFVATLCVNKDVYITGVNGRTDGQPNDRKTLCLRRLLYDGSPKNTKSNVSTAMTFFTESC